MSRLNTAQQFVHFADFTVDLQAGELRKGGTRIKLQVQPFQVLQTLLERPGQAVTREELQKRIWPVETFVDFDHGLNNAVKKLREALGDDAERPRFIETLAKRGYRFVGTVQNGSPTSVPDSASQPAAVPAAAPETTTLFSHRRGFLWGLGLGGALAVALVLVLGLNTGGLQDRLFRRSTTPRIQSLAVLPLQDLPNDPAQEYLSDGLTDALITELGQTGSLKVISRTSSMQYKGTKKSLPEIASELKVDGIIEGTVQRLGDRVRITAQLIDGRSDHHVWANSYERDMRDMFALEREVTEDITRHVQERLPRADSVLLAQPQRLDAKALEAYLQGSYYLNGYGKGSGDEEKRTAAKYFQQVIDANPKFAPAYDRLANTHLYLLWPSNGDAEIAKQNAERAVALDPNFSEAHCTLGDINFGAWNWKRAEEEYRRAIALNPNNANAHDDFGSFLDAMGRMNEGWRESQIAQELDPSYDHLSNALARRGQDDQAIAIQKMMLQRNPDDGYEHVLLFREYLRMGMYEDAAMQLDRVSILFGFAQIATGSHRAHGVSGSRSAIRESLKGWERLWATHQAFLPVNFAEIYASLGDKDRAFYWLEQAYAHHDIGKASTDVGLEWLYNDFLLNSLRSDSRFKDLVRRVGLPEILVGNSAASKERTGHE